MVRRVDPSDKVWGLPLGAASGPGDDLRGRPDVADRMRVEALALALVQHPNLVAVHDLGRTPDGRAYSERS